MSEYESAAMWKLYMYSDGVALQSSFGRFVESVTVAPQKVLLGKVQYLDYRDGFVPDGNMVAPFFYKRHSFEHEREVRGLVQQRPVDPETSEVDWEIDSPKGVSVPVDLNRLIETIYVSPASPSWFFDLVKAVVQRFGLNRPVLPSTLDATPVF